MPQLFDESALGDLGVVGTLLNVVLALGLGQIVAWHYQRYGRVLTDRRRLGRVLALLAATTMLMISVVKTSLALSLGLVGALSIVRFRTPVKEPEELAYLFLVIAAGIGIGADQRVVTVVVVATILGYLGLRNGMIARDTSTRSLLQVEIPVREEGSGEALASAFIAFVGGAAREASLRRLDRTSEAVHGTVLLDLRDGSELDALLAGIAARFPGTTYSVVDREGLD
ncbi:MAG: DUF4956 domain-containing protein [Planctomycetota bacterium]